MKNRLIYQNSEYDCGPTTLNNAVRFLFHREEVPPALVKGIWMFGNDTFNDRGENGKHGTSKTAMRFLADWITDFGRGWKFPIRAEYVDFDEAEIVPGSRTVRCLETGGAALMRCWSGGHGHYVLLTSIEDWGIGLWDPYDEPHLEFSKEREGRLVVHDQPHRLNRIVRMDIMNGYDVADYAMGSIDKRVNVLLWNTRTEIHP